MGHPELYPPQMSWVKALGQCFTEHRSVMGHFPTGGGKSVCIAYIARQLVNQGKRVMLTVHRQEILLQMSQHLLSFGLEHNLICSQEVKMLALTAAAKTGVLMSPSKVTLASLPSLARQPQLPVIDYLIVDEAHHAAAKTWSNMIREYANEGIKVLGVTATPERSDGQPLYPLFKHLLYGPSIQKLIENGFLSPFEIYEPEASISRRGLHMIGGDYKASEVADRARVIVGSAIKEYAKHLLGKRCLIFCANVSEAEKTANDFAKAGYAAASVDGRMAEAERNRRLTDLRNGSLKLITSCQVLGEGVDVPTVEGMIDMQPTFSRGKYLQNFGRVLRFVPGKTAIVLDHAGNRHFHGNPMDITSFSFYGREKQKRGESEATVSLRHCSKCFMPYPTVKLRCPYCGCIPARAENRGPEQVAGELNIEARQETPVVVAAKELADLTRNGGLLSNNLIAIAKKHRLGDQWIMAMQARMEWWATPIGERNIERDIERGSMNGTE